MAVLLAASLSPFAGCGKTGPATGLSLKLHPDSSCASAPVACVDHLAVNLKDPLGAPLGAWNLPFTIAGAAQPLGNLPNHGEGRFRVQGVASATTTSVLVFSGTSGTVTFDPKNDQSVLVNVSCPAIADPCGANPTPTPTPPLFVSGTAANLVLGQTTFTACANNVTITARLGEPESVCTDGTQVYVSDFLNARGAVWNDSTTVTNGQAIDFVLGHSTTSNTGPGGLSNFTLSAARGIAVIPGTAAIVMDRANNRGALWTPLATASGATITYALGQSNNTNGGSGNSNQRLNAPWGVAWSSTTGLFVADESNNRVVGYGNDTANIFVNNATATLVLGQTAFNTGNRNAGNGATVSGAGLDSPHHLATDGKRLYVADTNNHRVLVWLDVKNATNGQPADFAIGQPDLVTHTAGTGSTGLNLPTGVAATKDRLAIADQGNNRVLIWQPPPNSSADPATQVLGQPDFATVTPNTGGAAGDACSSTDCHSVPRSPIAASLNQPANIWFEGNNLWIADTCNQRALRFTAH